MSYYGVEERIIVLGIMATINISPKLQKCLGGLRPLIDPPGVSPLQKGLLLEGEELWMRQLGSCNQLTQLQKGLILEGEELWLKQGHVISLHNTGLA